MAYVLEGLFNRDGVDAEATFGMSSDGGVSAWHWNQFGLYRLLFSGPGHVFSYLTLHSYLTGSHTHRRNTGMLSLWVEGFLSKI